MRRYDSYRTEVALVQMPFAVTAWPSLGLGLLKASLEESGIASKVLYLNAVFADRVGEKTYQPLSIGSPQNTDLLGEWVFAEALWGVAQTNDDSYFHEVIGGRSAAHYKTAPMEEIEAVWANAQLCRAHAEGYLQGCLEDYDWGSFRVVGFTSVFQQHLAALALAKRLKAKFPHLAIVFGGSNCEGLMGLATLRAFPFIDAVCIGEGDTAFPAYVKALRAGQPPEPSNIVTRERLDLLDADGAGVVPAPAPVIEMDALPYPDYDDFFEQCGDRAPNDSIPCRLIFETSRGCWWGQKHHCTFCGLNGTTMAFRHKTARRAVDEIQHLLARYGKHTQQLAAADNIIPYKYFDEFLPELVKLNMDVSIFYETKANLRKDQLITYHRAGLREIQPGIESLDTNILRLMRKGVTGIQNIQLLKWCKELGVAPLWNYIYGFPGEDAAAYDQVATKVWSLGHLDPPMGIGKLRFDRFSPYVSNPERFGITGLAPYPAYAHLYPELSSEARSDLAYYFAGTFSGSDNVSSYTTRLREEVETWRRQAPGNLLAHVTEDDSTLIFDVRGERPTTVFLLRGLFHKIVAESDGIISLNHLSLEQADVESLPTVVKELERRGLIFREDELVIRLSIPLLSDYTPPFAAMDRLQNVLISQPARSANADLIQIDKTNVVCLDS